MTPQSCPIREDVSRIQAHSQNLVKIMRKLRRDLNTCQNCACVEDCEVLKTFHSKVQAALLEVTEEWNLTELVNS